MTNISFEMLQDKQEELAEVPDFKLASAERTLEDSISQLLKADEKETQMHTLKEMHASLVEAKEEDTSLLNALKPSLEKININCESNATASEDINNLLNTLDECDDVEFSEEGLLAGAVLVYLLFRLMLEFKVLKDTGVWLSLLVTKLKKRDFDELEEGDAEEVESIITYDQFSKLIPAYVKCLQIFRDEAQKFDEDSFGKIQSTMYSIGVTITDDGEFDDKGQERFDAQKVKLGESGWTAKTLNTAIAELQKAADILLGFEKLLKRAKAKGKKVNDSIVKKELEKDEEAPEEMYKKWEVQKKAVNAAKKFFKYVSKDIREYAKDVKYVASAFTDK